MHKVAALIVTTLRPSLLRAVRSVFAQDLKEPIHLMIGVDVPDGDIGMFATIQAECPSHITLTVLNLGYSTSARHGGFYPNSYGGSLRTILSYAADAPFLAYLDDDDWWAPNHLSGLLTVISDKDWAFSLRMLTDRETGRVICRDEWDSVGPGKGINNDYYGGFCCPSTLMLNKQCCHFLLPKWSLAAFADGGGEDRLMFEDLKEAGWASSGLYSCFYELSVEAQNAPHHRDEFAKRGILWPFERDRIKDLPPA